jgi:hypothetical protein
MRMPLTRGNLNVQIENQTSECDEAETGGKNENSHWYWWKKMRSLCEESQRLSVVLELTADLPSDEEVERWFSEPVRAIVIPTSLFLTNKSGFPVLSKPHQRFVFKFLNVIPLATLSPITHFIALFIYFVLNYSWALISL